MKILHVVDVDSGGVVRLAETFAAAQVDRGHRVHLLAPFAPPPGVTGHTWAVRRRRPDSLVSGWRRLRRVVAERRPDVVHLHSFFPGLLGRAGALPAAVVYQPHSWAFAAARGAGRPVALWERLALRSTDVVVVNCADELSEAAAAGVRPHVARVVGVPVDTDHFRPGEGAPPWPEVPGGAGLVVCVGRICRQKGQVELAAAWERSPIPGARLVLVGAGDAASVAAAAPHEFGRSLHAVGATDDVRAWLWAADVAVMPSRYEGQSVAMAEALACGVPVLMTPVNGAREAIAPDDGPAAGVVVGDVDDLDALLAAAAHRLADPTLRDAERAAARERAVELFGPAQVMERIEAAYRVAIGRGSR